MDCNGVSEPSNRSHVRFPVSIEVADRYKRRAVPRELHGSTKRSVTFPQQNRYVEVGNNQIQVAVTIEVRRRQGLRCKVGGEINMRLKRPIAIAQQNGNGSGRKAGRVAAALVGRGNVSDAILVEITRHHPGWSKACREGRIIKDIALSHCVRAKEGEKSEQAKHDSKNIPAPNARFRASYGCVRSRVGGRQTT